MVSHESQRQAQTSASRLAERELVTAEQAWTEEGWLTEERMSALAE